MNNSAFKLHSNLRVDTPSCVTVFNIAVDLI